MYLNVKERGSHVATFRWIDVRLMEMLASWVPTTPEMEAKLVFGTHIWDFAQHADSLGKRTHELRLPPQHSLEPSEEYVQFLTELAATKDTSKRIAGFYDCVLPARDKRLCAYLERVDPLLDGPTVRIIDRMRYDAPRMASEAKALRDEMPALRLADVAWLDDLRQRESAAGSNVVRQQAEAKAA